MTFREKLFQEKPDCVGVHYVGGCIGCPAMHGYETWGESRENCDGERVADEKRCRACWDREMKEERKKDMKKKDMKKKDLKSEMVAETRNGVRWLVLEKTGRGGTKRMILASRHEMLEIEDYSDDLTYKWVPDYDIMKLFFPAGGPIQRMLESSENLIWSRKETKEITAEEAFRVLREHYGEPVSIAEE